MEQIVSETNKNRERMEDIGKLCFGKIYDASVITGKALKKCGGATLKALKTSYEYVHGGCKKVFKKFF